MDPLIMELYVVLEKQTNYTMKKGDLHEKENERADGNEPCSNHDHEPGSCICRNLCIHIIFFLITGRLDT